MFEILFLVGNRADFARAAVAAGIQFAVDDHPGAQPRADNQADQILITASGAKVQFTEGKTLGIVVQDNGNVKPAFENFLEGNDLPGRDVVWRIYNSLVHQGRHTDADAAHVRSQNLRDGFADLINDGFSACLWRMRPRFKRSNFAVLNQACADVCATEVNANQVVFFAARMNNCIQFRATISQAFGTCSAIEKIKGGQNI